MKFCGGQQSKLGRGKVLKNAGRILIVLIFIPLLIASAGVSMGMVEKKPVPTGGFIWNAGRTANDTIVITNNGYYSPDGADPGKYVNDTYFIIRINGKAANDSVQISKSKLNLTIYPETGLRCEPGQKVTLVGPDVSRINDTLIEIDLYYREELVYIDGMMV
jgi:hypothetical protein